MAHVLGVGVATLDIISEVDSYPPEDSEVRALGRRVVRGGNAANSLAVLSQLGHDCAWAGTYVTNAEGQFVIESLGANRIDVSYAVSKSCGEMPVSCVTLNRANGSRTIVHYRDLPEYPFDAFRKIALDRFDWLHFEGRNIDEVRMMLDHARRCAPHVMRSVEIEKPRDGVDTLFEDADVLLFSRVYGDAWGVRDSDELFDALNARAQGKVLVCSQGPEGAVAQGADGKRYRSPAFPPDAMVDTLGAGDTLNAGVIDGLLRGRTLPETLTAACRLAGRKCGQSGLDGLGYPS